MATQEYWSAVEDKGLRHNEITCAWILVLAAVVVLQIITSLAATPFCPRGTSAAIAKTSHQATPPARERASNIGGCRQAFLPAPLGFS